jgi:hypothetical protein
MFVSYSAKQHRYPATDIPPCLASHTKDASPDVIHLLARDQLPSLLAQGQQQVTPFPAPLRNDLSLRNVIF